MIALPRLTLIAAACSTVAAFANPTDIHPNAQLGETYARAISGNGNVIVGNETSTGVTSDIAAVRLNGHALPVLWTAPFRADRGSRMAGPCYTRQLFDTFLLDAWLPPGAADTDALVLFDTDSPPVAVLALSAVVRPGEPLLTPMMRRKDWHGTATFLGESAEWTSMQINVMPWLTVAWGLLAARLLAAGGTARARSIALAVLGVVALAPLGFFSYGGLIAVQALWAGPWLTQVAGQ